MFSWLKILSTLVSLGVMIAGSIMLVSWLQESGRYPIRVVEVRNELKHLAREEVVKQIKPQVSKGFFGLKIQAIQDSLSNLAWVDSVSVRRVWPDKVIVSVTEKTPQAFFGKDGLLSTEGRLFYPEDLDIQEKLPKFKGPSDRAKEMLKQYFVMLELLGPIGLSITELDLSLDGSFKIMLDNGIAIILGRVGLTERLARFVLAYKVGLQTHKDKIAYVDLRYTNGVSVGWKTGEQVTANVQKANVP